MRLMSGSLSKKRTWVLKKGRLSEGNLGVLAFDPFPPHLLLIK
jgi:hypothetical protein